MKLKYQNEETTHDVEFKKISKNIVEIIGDFPIKTNGFTLSRNDKDDKWDYSSFTTVYKVFENCVQFSNDGSVYVEPEVFEPKEPTEEELQAIFESTKARKISESKQLLADYLESHPLVSNCHGGIEAKYSVTTEKQSLMANNYLTYTIAKETGVDAVLTWNATGQECEVWTEEEYITLVLQISEYVKPLVSLQQSYEVQIKNFTTQDELDILNIVYDVYGISAEEDNV